MAYLRRLATTGAAYTAYSALSKLIAVFLLPLYTRYLTPQEYGAAEVLMASVITASIAIRLGMIEAILRFYYLPDADRRQVVAGGFAVLVWSATIAGAIGLATAAPISTALLGHQDAGLVRIAIVGLWAVTLWEYVLALLRLEERARAYLAITVANVLVTIPLTVWLVVLERQVVQTDSNLHAAENQLRELTNDQSRLRQNIDSLNRVTGQEEPVHPCRFQGRPQLAGIDEIVLNCVTRPYYLDTLESVYHLQQQPGRQRRGPVGC